MRRTRCACSNVAPETKQFPNAYILDNKVPSETLRIISQTDRIRAQHDRGKEEKRLSYQLLNNDQGKLQNTRNKIA